MDWKTMINACSDINKDGSLKTSFYITLMKKDLNGNEVIEEEIGFSAPCNIYTNHKEMQIDLVFSDNTDETLNILVEKINRFRNANAAIVDETNIFPFVNMVVVPDEYQGKYYFICLDAYAITLTSYSTMVLPHILRFNFDLRNNDVLLMEDNSVDEMEEDITDDIFLENPVPESVEKEIAPVAKKISPIEEEDDDEEDDELY